MEWQAKSFIKLPYGNTLRHSGQELENQRGVGLVKKSLN